MVIELKPRHRKALSNWTALNDFLRKCNNLNDTTLMWRWELRQPNPRPTFLRRILSRSKVLTTISDRAKVHATISTRKS